MRTLEEQIAIMETKVKETDGCACPNCSTDTVTLKYLKELQQRRDNDEKRAAPTLVCNPVERKG